MSAELALPTTRDENWKYTDLSGLASKPRIFFDHEIISFKNNTQPGIDIHASKFNFDKKSDLECFERLNQEFNTEYYEINISQNLSEPLEIIYTHTQNAWAQPRIKIIIKPNITAQIIETFASQTSNIINTVIDVVLETGAKLNYTKIQSENIDSFHIGRSYFLLNTQAHLQAFTLSKGSKLARSDIFVKFIGEQASCDLYGLSYSKSRQHLDHHTVVNHAVANCKSNEFYKSILDEKSRVVFNGKIIVEKDAHHTESNQMNHNILLSSDAEIDTKPELEIYHDDVKCTHGATIGQLDEKAFFYLRSRGIGAEKAREILIQAFGHQVINFIADKNLRERLCQY